MLAKQHSTVLGEPWVFKQPLTLCLVIYGKAAGHFPLAWGVCHFIKAALGKFACADWQKSD